MNIKEYVKTLSHPFRGNCPKCFGDNCFSTSIANGVIQYYCFRASCNLKGRISYEVSIDELRDSNNGLFNSNNNSFTISSRSTILGNNFHPLVSFKLPEYFISPLQNNKCYSYLQRYNLIDFYSKHIDRIRYDPKENRCVFILKDDEGVKGAVGRNLNYNSTIPRWFVYKRYLGSIYLVANSTSSLVLVEDCISASYLYQNNINACALLGTSLPNDTIRYLLKYDKL